MSSPTPPQPPQPHAASASHGLMSSILDQFSTAPPKQEVEVHIAPKELPDGYRLRNYKIKRVLGAGGFGITYLAVEDLFNRPVVIKENFPDTLCYRESKTMRVRLNEESSDEIYNWALNNFLREVRLLAALDHEYIAKVYSFFEAHGTAYFVSEYVDGKSLGDVAKGYAECKMFIPQEALYGTLVRILDALDYLHRRNLLHRDIKPDNVLITRQGMPVLIDFGAAREEYGDGGAGVVETLGFSPAEQSDTNGNMGPWTDLYALGATFYFILTGECLPNSKQRELYDTVDPLANHPDLSRVYNKHLLMSIDRALQPAIHQRYASVSEWMHDLRGRC